MRSGRHVRTRIRSMARSVRAGARVLRPFIERRKGGRMKGTRLGCNLGMVADLSGGGMRIRSRRKYHGVQKVELWTRTTRVKLDAEAVWSKKITFRRYETGFRFVELTPQISAQLSSLALYLRNE